MNFSLKTLLLTIFILGELAAFSTLAVTPSAVISVPPVSSNETPELNPLLKPMVTISFIIARRRDCQGFGICRWEASVSFERTQSATGIMYVDDTARGRFIIEIDKLKGITSETYEKYFKSGVFLMEDDSPIPAEILKSLGISGSRIVPAGKHLVTERNGILYLSVPVK